MPVCARGVQQPDGSVLLALDPLATDFTACTYVVESGADLSNSFLLMTAQDGALFSSGIISVWAAAFWIRSIISVIKGSQDV
jgi:hypothetical protein